MYRAWAAPAHPCSEVLLIEPRPTRRTHDRRQFLRAGALGIGVLSAPAVHAFGRSRSDALRLGVVGVGGRGAANLAGVAGEQVRALCDVDAGNLAAAHAKHGKASCYRDFRRMLETEQLDAVVVSTADHTHAQITASALEAGLDVYCEKPLTHTVAEVRRLRELAREHEAVTQMGTQIHAGANYRRVVERVRAGQLGAVREVHVFCGKNWGGKGRPATGQEVPASLDYDLWLGPCDEPYSPSFHPAGWRRYWPFGGGTLGDMACHYADLAWWALDLGLPSGIEARGPEVDAFSAPAWVEVEYRFAERPGVHGPLTVTWSDGGKRPRALADHGLNWSDGVLFVGEKASLISSYGNHEVLPSPGAEPASVEHIEAPPPSIPNSVGHYKEWLDACRTRGETTCSFDYSGRLTESVLLGVVAYRAGAALQYDGETGTARGADVSELLAPARREGWQLP